MKFIDQFKVNNCQTSATIQPQTDTAEKKEVVVTPAMKQVLDELFIIINDTNEKFLKKYPKFLPPRAR